jgi:uncharacterized membrane protein
MTLPADPLQLATLPYPSAADVAPPAPRRAGTALAWGIAAGLFTLYAALAIRDQQRMLTGGFDLGIFDEAVRAYAHGHLPYVSLKGAHFDLLGDHFSPIWITLAPVYWLFPSVYTLLLAQALLMAVAAVPLVLWAARAVGLRTAAIVGGCYGLSWGIASAAGFDVHEVAFAVPLLAFSGAALGQRRWRAAAAWGLPLLAVKEDLGFTLAAIGLYIAACGARRLGLATAVIGALGSVLEIEVLIPAFSPGGTYTYTSSFSRVFAGGLVALPRILVHLITPQTKVITLMSLLVCTGFLALRSPITLLVLPTLAWRFLSTDQVYWGTGYQYSAVLMPIVFAGLVHALTLLRAGGHREARTIAGSGLATCLVATALLVPDGPLWGLTAAATWHTDPRIAAARHVIAMVPSGATVAAGNQLVPQLTDRDTVMLLDTTTPSRRPGWVLIDTENPGDFPLRGGQQTQIVAQLEGEGYHTVADQAGYVLLER